MASQNKLEGILPASFLPAYLLFASKVGVLPGDYPFFGYLLGLLSNMRLMEKHRFILTPLMMKKTRLKTWILCQIPIFTSAAVFGNICNVLMCILATLLDD
jgi:hypothetical protein